MPTIIRRTETVLLTDKRRDVVNAVGWQVTSSLWTPPTDVYETDASFVVRVEVAGMHESDFTIKQLPDLNHLFQHCQSGSPSEYGEIEETFSPDALAIVGDWILERMK